MRVCPVGGEHWGFDVERASNPRLTTAAGGRLDVADWQRLSTTRSRSRCTTCSPPSQATPHRSTSSRRRSTCWRATRPTAQTRSCQIRYHSTKPTMVPQQTLDTIVWQSVYGANSTPPVPGPTAAAGDQ